MQEGGLTTMRLPCGNESKQADLGWCLDMYVLSIDTVYEVPVINFGYK